MPGPGWHPYLGQGGVPGAAALAAREISATQKHRHFATNDPRSQVDFISCAFETFEQRLEST
jgi:hypothetical protein